MWCVYSKWKNIWAYVFWLFAAKLWIELRVSVTNCLIGMGVAFAIYFVLRYEWGHNEKIRTPD